MMVPSFNTDFSNCHRFSVITLCLLQLLLRDDHILHEKEKARISTQESEGWTTPVALY